MKLLFKFFCIITFAIISITCAMACDNHIMSVAYYDDIHDASLDIENQEIGKRAMNDHSLATIMVKNGECPEIVLLNNVTSNKQLTLSNTILNLNGYELSFYCDEGLILSKKSQIIGTVQGSKLSITNTNGATLISVNRTGNVTINGGEYIVNSKAENLMGIHVFGKANIQNANIKIDGSNDENINVASGIYANLFSKINVSDCNINVNVQNGEAYGIFSRDYAEVSNSNIVALSNYMSNEVDFTILSIGCYSEEFLKLTNCNIAGIHSGVNSLGTVEIDGGTYSGFGHGGVYFSGASSTAYAQNASFLEIPMPEGYQTYGPQSTHAGFYIGGGEKQDNIVVYMDNCYVESTGHAFVLRGSSGEQNNSLYISNTTIKNKSIRIDNNSHKLIIGNGCNFTKEHTTLPEAVEETALIYVKTND